VDPAGPGKERPSAAHPGRGWLPARVCSEAGRPVVEWVDFGARRLLEPFYEHSVDQAARDAQVSIATPLENLTSMAGPPSLAPTGFIFHMSRCGSTLAAQMLAASVASVVVSEAQPIDAVVRLAGAGVDRIALLRAMVRTLGQVRNAGETRYFVKLDSWHARAMPLFRQAFPATPWIFLYRDPAQVMASHARRTGMQMVAELVDPRVYGLDPEDQTWGEGYRAGVLASICEAALDAGRAGGGLFVSYAELPNAVWTKVLPHFGVTPCAGEVAAMAAAAQFDPKASGSRFASEVEVRRLAPTPAIQAAVRGRLASAFRRLEAARAG